MNFLTFDIEEWFMSYDSSQLPLSLWDQMPARMPENIEVILQFLDSMQVKATFFIMGWIAEKYPDTVKAISDAGHEIGYHSYFHELPENQGPQAFEADLVKGLQLLESIIGNPVTLYRAPRFSLSCKTAWTIPILKKHGITISSSMMSGTQCRNDRIPAQPFIMEHAGITLTEVPLNRQLTLGLKWVYTGSGYFRILPWSIIHALYRKSRYNMAYFHPRDFDTHVPATQHLPWYRNIMSSLGNQTTIPKLQKLMQHINFSPLTQTIQNTTRLPIIKM